MRRYPTAKPPVPIPVASLATHRKVQVFSQTMAIIKCYVAVLSVFFFVLRNASSFKVHFPPTDDKTHPRLQIQSLPALEEFTFCSWARLFNLSGTVPHILSYATERTDDEIAVFFYTKDSLVLGAVQVVNHYVSFNCSFVDWKEISWHHVCTSWLSVDGSTRFFVDGERCSPYGTSFGPISVGESVLGDGTAILGQEQGGLGSKFDVHEAWRGDLSDVNLWSEILTEDQIKEASSCGGAAKEGTVISWSKTPMAAFDGIVIRKEDNCER